MLEDPKYRAKFAVTLSQPATAPCSAAYELVAGTALPDVDYSPAAGSLEFAVGEDTKEILVDVRDIYLGDPTAFKLRVTSPQGLTFARAEGDALIPGKSLHDILHDTFTGVDGTVFGHQPEIGGLWEDLDAVGEGAGPMLVGGSVQFGRPWSDYPSGYVKPMVPVIPAAGTLSLKVKIDSFTIDPAPEANESTLVVSMFMWSGPGAGCELSMELRTGKLLITASGVEQPYSFPYVFPVGVPFEVELRYEQEAGWLGVYVDGVWVYSQACAADSSSVPVMDIMNIYAYGFESLLINELRVQQGGPGTTHEQVVIPPPPIQDGYLADTFFGTGPLSLHQPEFGVTPWTAWNANSPLLNGAGQLTFAESNAEVSCDGMVDAGIPTNGPTRVFLELKTLPAQGRFTFGVADVPTIGQSATGAQAELDFGLGVLSVISAAASNEFPFPVGWETMLPLNVSMYLGTGNTSVLVWFNNTYVGSIYLESAVGDMSNFKFFFRAENTPELEMERVLLLAANPVDLQVPGGPWLSDSFTGTGAIEGHMPEIGGSAWEQLNFTGTRMPELSGGMLRFSNVAESSKGIAIPASNMSGVYGVVAEIGTVGDTGDFTMGVASDPMSGQSYSGSQVRLNFDSTGDDTVSIISTYGASTPVAMPAGWRALPEKFFEMRITTGDTNVGAYLNGELLVEYAMESPIGAPTGFKFFLSAFEAYALTLDRVRIIPDGIPAPEITMLHTRDDFDAAGGTLLTGQVPNITENNAAWRDLSEGPDGGFFRQNGGGDAEVILGTDPGSYSKMAYAFLDLLAGTSFKLEFALHSVDGGVLAATGEGGPAFGKIFGMELRCTDSGENVTARLDNYSGGGGVWSAIAHSNMGGGPGHEYAGGVPGAAGASVKFTIEWGNETLTMKVDDVVVDTMSTDDGGGAPGNPAGPAYLYLEVAKGNYLEYVDVVQTPA